MLNGTSQRCDKLALIELRPCTGRAVQRELRPTGRAAQRELRPTRVSYLPELRTYRELDYSHAGSWQVGSAQDVFRVWGKR